MVWIVSPLRLNISVGTKPQCTRSFESNANVACCRWSAESPARNVPAACAIATGERSAARTAPSHARTHAVATTSRGDFSTCMSAPFTIEYASMAARPTWKGYLKISLVNIPVKVFPATDAGATLSFNQLHAECQTRIQQKRWCPNCQREVPNTDIVKGYEFEKGHYVVVDEEDVEKVRVESTRVINLEKFTDDTAIDPIYLERPY